MPASTYSHYKDPETGKTILLPQLFPHASCTGIISPTKLKDWVSSGIIPKEMYESYIKDHQVMEQTHKKLSNGEKVLKSDLPPKPWALTDFLLKNKGAVYGENVLKEIFSNLDKSDPDILWLSFTKEAITSIATQDPLPIHFLIARKFLKEKVDIEDSAAVDLLARKIVEHCSKIKKFKIFSHPVFEKNPIDPKDLNEHFEDEYSKILSIDVEFVNYLKGMGGKGKELAKEVKKNCEALYKIYEDNKFSQEIRPKLWGLWVTKKEDETGISPFLTLVAEASWSASCSSLWHRQSRQTPAITKPIIERIKPMLNPKEKKRFLKHEGDVVCVDQKGSQLMIAPAIDPDMITLLQKGVKDLSTLTGHRLLRWQIKTGFEKWSSGEADPRVVEVEGGYSGIASLSGSLSPKEIARVKAILHAQAYGQFIYPDGSRGNMITLRVLDRHKNNEPSKISLVLGDMLLPNYVFKIGNKRERRLIPIGDLPPLSGSKNTHAFQAHLQLLVFEEFSCQSDTLADNGYVVIPKEKWVGMAVESGLNPQKIDQIINYWCQPDMVNCFLDRQGDAYRLASYYEDAQNFLIYQGEQRTLNSKKGKASAVGRKKSKSKKS